MKQHRLSFVAGAVTMLLLISIAITAFAAYEKQATLVYRDVKITLDGQQIIPKDANGNAIEPFLIDGTTYLPVRGISTAVGLGVGWDDSRNTVVLTSPDTQKITYITRTGSKYHDDNRCNGGTYWEVPLSTATGMGLEPCAKCIG